MIDEIYKPKEPSRQLQIKGIGTTGEMLMLKAKAWIDEHPEIWEWYKAQALKATKSGYASPNYLLQSMRHTYHVGVCNSIAAALARIAMEENPRICFRLHKSKTDGFVFGEDGLENRSEF